jgi:hypothetical protein
MPGGPHFDFTDPAELFAQLFGDQLAGVSAPPPPLRTNRTRRVLHPVLIGHAVSLAPY